MKRKTLGVAIAVAMGVLSTSAIAFTPIANVSNKGSLLVYQRIDVNEADTLITLTNDSTKAVKLKCYYATSEPLNTPSKDSLEKIKEYKHYIDFTIDLTPNQPISWWAESGRAVGGSHYRGEMVAPPFGVWANHPSADKDEGEMKCWAVNASQSAEVHHNHLFGTATIINFESGQAAEYNATAFQALGPSTLTGTDLGSPGTLNLDNVEYDACANMLLGNFKPGGQYEEDAAGRDISSWNRVTLASCNQDLRQNYTPTITKLTWTFWNQDEQQRTGSHECADSWYETDFPADRLVNAQAYVLGTEAAYFRIETTRDTSICANASESSYTGIIERTWGKGYYRATELVGRGVAEPGAIKWDPQPADSYKK